MTSKKRPLYAHVSEIAEPSSKRQRKNASRKRSDIILRHDWHKVESRYGVGAIFNPSQVYLLPEDEYNIRSIAYSDHGIYLLSCGFLRSYSINPTNIARVLSKYLQMAQFCINFARDYWFSEQWQMIIIKPQLSLIAPQPSKSICIQMCKLPDGCQNYGYHVQYGIIGIPQERSKRIKFLEKFKTRHSEVRFEQLSINPQTFGDNVDCFYLNLMYKIKQTDSAANEKKISHGSYMGKNNNNKYLKLHETHIIDSNQSSKEKVKDSKSKDDKSKEDESKNDESNGNKNGNENGNDNGNDEVEYCLTNDDYISICVNYDEQVERYCGYFMKNSKVIIGANMEDSGKFVKHGKIKLNFNDYCYYSAIACTRNDDTEIDTTMRFRVFMK